MSAAPEHRISLSLAVDALLEASEEVRDLQSRLDDLRASRDRLIKDAYDNGMPMLKLARITGLSRERIYAITRSGVPQTGDK
jgi:hypothetical protein